MAKALQFFAKLLTHTIKHFLNLLPAKLAQKKQAMLNCILRESGKSNHRFREKHRCYK
jgi:hypothetical protein